MNGYGDKKGISIGVEDFKEIIDKNGYFVDKTLMIRDLIKNNAKVTLFTRPRRFGKTLNQFMIRRFFEDERTPEGEKIDNGYLFDGLKISECGEEILKHKQQYPVIFVSLKSAKQPDFDMAYKCLIDEIVGEFDRHRYVLESDKISDDKKEKFKKIARRQAEPGDYATSFKFLSECLALYHDKKVIILIDEYDVPLEGAYSRGFYDKMIDFIRSLFESALKTNPYLERAAITGCLRISKESIFTGLNNLWVDSIVAPVYPESFGFTQEEVSDMLSYYELESLNDEVKQWYDGYIFGETEIYNPWSIINYIYANVTGASKLPRAYWSNTSSNTIVRELVEDADDKTREELEILMNGGTIEKPVHEEIVYADIHLNKDNLWNFLFFTGYLKLKDCRREGGKLYIILAIPNLEIGTIYENSIYYWFEEKKNKMDRSTLIKALEEGDCETAEDFISKTLMETISYYDYSESYYHAFLAGLLSGAGGYLVKSNHESGEGRPDIVLWTQRIRKGRIIILEVKTAKNIREMEQKCEEALVQIEEKKYAEPFFEEGYPRVDKYGVCFYKKECMIIGARE